MEHFELQAHTKIPASDLEKDGAGRVLSRPNESQCWGVQFKNQVLFFYSPHMILKYSKFEHPMITPFYRRETESEEKMCLGVLSGRAGNPTTISEESQAGASSSLSHCSMRAEHNDQVTCCLV